jgi:hypothetical protein
MLCSPLGWLATSMQNVRTCRYTYSISTCIWQSLRIFLTSTKEAETVSEVIQFSQCCGWLLNHKSWLKAAAAMSAICFSFLIHNKYLSLKSEWVLSYCYIKLQMFQCIRKDGRIITDDEPTGKKESNKAYFIIPYWLMHKTNFSSEMWSLKPHWGELEQIMLNFQVPFHIYYWYKLAPQKLKLKWSYDRRSVGQSVWVSRLPSGAHE